MEKVEKIGQEVAQTEQDIERATKEMDALLRNLDTIASPEGKKFLETRIEITRKTIEQGEKALEDKRTELHYAIALKRFTDLYDQIENLRRILSPRDLREKKEELQNEFDTILFDSKKFEGVEQYERFKKVIRETIENL